MADFLKAGHIHHFFEIKQGMRIADFGCGSGDFAIFAARKTGESGKVSAIDVMPTALESVRARAKAAGLTNIVEIRGNLEKTGGSKLESDSQDMVYIGNMLTQSKKHAEVIEEAKRILKSRGALAAIEWKKGVSLGPPDELRVDQHELKQLISDAGLQVEKEFDAGDYHYGLVAKKP